jgi:hypothetical protein
MAHNAFILEFFSFIKVMLYMWVPEKVNIYFILQKNGKGGHLGYFENLSLECLACSHMSS